MVLHEQNRKLIERYWKTLSARDWEGFKSTLFEDVVYDIPQTHERVRGLDPYLDFNATFPGGWTIEVVQVVADDTQAAGQITFRVGGQEMTGISFFKFKGGKISHITDFWPEAYEPPARMSRWVERV